MGFDQRGCGITSHVLGFAPKKIPDFDLGPISDRYEEQKVRRDLAKILFGGMHLTPVHPICSVSAWRFTLKRWTSLKSGLARKARAVTI